jgi:hypothetical protein
MNKVIAWIQKINLRQILTVFMAGILLFFTQACTGANAVSPRQSSQPAVRPNAEVYVPKGENILNPPEGGMNNFTDVDPRSKEAASQAKTQAEFLKENAAQKQATKQTSNPAEAVGRVGADAGKLGKNIQQKAADLGEKVQETAEDFSGATQKETAEDFSGATQRGIENIKENTKGGGSYLKQTAEETTGNPNPIDSIKQGAKEAADAVNKNIR